MKRITFVKNAKLRKPNVQQAMRNQGGGSSKKVVGDSLLPTPPRVSPAETKQEEITMTNKKQENKSGGVI